MYMRSKALHFQLRSVLSWIFCVGASLFFIIYSSVVLLHQPPMESIGFGKVDFAVFYVVGSIVTGETQLTPHDLYNGSARRVVLDELRAQLPGGTRFLYPPQAALLFAPWSLLPFSVAVQAWEIAIALAFVAGYYLLIVGLLHDKPHRLRYSVLLIALPFSDPVLNLFFTGQVNALVLLGMLLGLYGMVTNRPILSGISFGMVITIKVFPVLFVPYLLLKRQWKAAAVTLGVVGLVWAVSLPMLGIAPTQEYVTRVMPSISSGRFIGGGTSLYGSWMGAVTQGTLNLLPFTRKELKRAIKHIHLVGTLCAAIGIGWVLLRQRRSREARTVLLEYGLLMLFILLFSRSIQTQYHLYLLPIMLFSMQLPFTQLYVFTHLINGGALLLTHFWSAVAQRPGAVFLLFKGPTLGMIMLFLLLLHSALSTQPHAHATHRPHHPGV